MQFTAAYVVAKCENWPGPPAKPPSLFWHLLRNLQTLKNKSIKSKRCLLIWLKCAVQFTYNMVYETITNQFRFNTYAVIRTRVKNNSYHRHNWKSLYLYHLSIKDQAICFHYTDYRAIVPTLILGYLQSCNLLYGGYDKSNSITMVCSHLSTENSIKIVILIK